MKINNGMLMAVCNAMENCYNRANTITKKWAVTDVAKRYYDVKATFDMELNKIIKEQGEDGQISTDNEDF
ncbi:MAG: hypothetical protein LUF02_09075 [Erysipelotrichaceae bacterium]|nr:hypothetical protein [Erysipelotrichaceae bacterium]